MGRPLSAILLLLGFSLFTTGCVSVETPKAAVRGASLQSVEVDSFTLAVDVQVSNPNDYEIPLRALNYTLTVGGIEVLDGKSRVADLRVPAGETRSVTMPVRIHHAELLGVANELVATHGEFNFHLTGEARFRPPGILALFGTIPAPYTYDGKLPLREALRDPKTLADPDARALAGELFKRFFEGR